MSIAVMIPLDQIEIGKRVRPSTDAKVAALAGSIREGWDAGIGNEGLRLPIEVRKGEEKGAYILISGLNRLRAVQSLERTEIAAFVVDVDDMRAELMELEENLVRADLTALDRAYFVKRFREIFEAEHGEIAQGGDRKSADFKDENQRSTMPLWSDAIIERLGMSLDMCKRALRVANGLHSDVPDMLRGTGWDDNQKALLELAGVKTEKQKDVVNILLDEENGAASMREAIAMLEGAKTPGEQDAALKKWYAVTNLHKRDQVRVAREWIAKSPEVFEEIFAERGFTVTLKVK